MARVKSKAKQAQQPVFVKRDVLEIEGLAPLTPLERELLLVLQHGYVPTCSPHFQLAFPGLKAAGLVEEVWMKLRFGDERTSDGPIVTLTSEGREETERLVLFLEKGLDALANYIKEKAS